jgi:hypothetical protein
MFFTNTYRPTIRRQSCSGYPGTESCSIGTTELWTAAVSLWREGFGYEGPDYSGPISYSDTTFTEQRCNPSGVLFSTGVGLAMRLTPASAIEPAEERLLSGCVIRVEFL